MKAAYTVGLMTLITLSGCAHSTMRGSVAMKASADEAHVCLGEGEVKQGDRVSFYRNVCPSGKARAEGGSCRKEKLGEGEIVRTLNAHYSVAKVAPGVQFEEGTIVERN